MSNLTEWLIGRYWHHGLAAAGLVLLSSMVSGLYAQDDVPAATHSVLQRAEQLLLEGSYAAAAELFQTADGADRIDGLIGASTAWLMLGNRQAAEQVVAAAIDPANYADSPLLSTRLAEVKRSLGQSAAALQILQSVVSSLAEPPVRTLVQYGSLLRFVGRQEAAWPILEQAVQRYRAGRVFTSEELGMVALASWLSGDFHGANRLFNEAIRANPRNLEAHTLWADLLLEKYNTREAGQGYQQILNHNSRYVPALVGMARVTGEARWLQQALAINADSVAALEAYGQWLINHGQHEEAQARLQRAVMLNPESVKALSLLAAQAALQQRHGEYQRYQAQVETFSPGNAEFLAHIADSFGRQYLFTEAVAYARAAIAADPQYWPGYTLLGSNLVRLGEETEGKANLETGFDNDPFNVMSSNMLKVFDTLETYTTRQSEHFKLRMNQRDADVLWPYLAPLLEEAWDTLSAKYDFVPQAPILLEVFDKAEDFAVRSVGLPDLGPLVGICFGKVITLISPDVLNANWQEIVWHEFVHVITLQMTGNRIPRWLSEGISVWEEGEGRPWWGREQGLELVRAVQQERLLPLADLNGGFSGARNNADLDLAYFQSYLVVDYIVSEYGFPRLLELVRQYALIKPDSERFSAVFDQPVSQFDAGFRRWLEQRVEQINVHVHSEDLPDEGEGHGHGIRQNHSAILAELYNPAALKQHMESRIEQNPRDFQAWLQLGIVLFREQNYEQAKSHLQIAHQLLPAYTGYPSPALVLSQIHQREGNRELQLQWLETLLESMQHDYDSALTLAEAAMAAQDYQRAAYYLDRAIEVDPYRQELHRLRAQYAQAVNDTGLAVTEYEVLMALEISDPVQARTNLAAAYLQHGQLREAKQQALYALEQAPGFRRAQRLLLESVARESTP